MSLRVEATMASWVLQDLEMRIADDQGLVARAEVLALVILSLGDALLHTGYGFVALPLKPRNVAYDHLRVARKSAAVALMALPTVIYPEATVALYHWMQMSPRAAGVFTRTRVLMALALAGVAAAGAYQALRPIPVRPSFDYTESLAGVIGMVAILGAVIFCRSSSPKVTEPVAAPPQPAAEPPKSETPVKAETPTPPPQPPGSTWGSTARQALVGAIQSPVLREVGVLALTEGIKRLGIPLPPAHLGGGHRGHGHHLHHH